MPGSNKVLLTVQTPLLREVIVDAIERTRSNIICGNAFPEVFDTLEYIRDALTGASEAKEEAKDIYRRLLGEHAYFINLSRLVSCSILMSNVANIRFSLVRASLFSARKLRTAALPLHGPNF
jgi:hypothetical protein